MNDDERDHYVRASDYNFTAQTRNLRNFARRLGRRRASALTLVAALIVLGMAVLFAPELGITGLGDPLRRWTLGALAFAGAAVVLVLTLRATARHKSAKQEVPGQPPCK